MSKSTGADLAKLTSLRFSNTHDLLGLSAENGVQSIDLANGVTANITLQDGKIVAHEARDMDGNKLKPFYAHLQPGQPTDPEGRVCWVCYTSEASAYGDEPTCFKIPCRML